MSDKKDFDSEYDRTVSLAHIKASGWDVGVYRHSNPFDCHFVYVCDYRTNHFELFSARRASFEEGWLDVPAIEITPLVLRLIKRHQRGRLNKREDQFFLPALITYVKGTKSYGIWLKEAGNDQRLHFVINIYPVENDAILRPFIMHEDKTVIDAVALIEVSNKVRQADSTQHPEWFKQ